MSILGENKLNSIIKYLQLSECIVNSYDISYNINMPHVSRKKLKKEQFEKIYEKLALVFNEAGEK